MWPVRSDYGMMSGSQLRVRAGNSIRSLTGLGRKIDCKYFQLVIISPGKKLAISEEGGNVSYR